MKPSNSHVATILPGSSTQAGGHRGVIDRSEYLIDRFRVRYAFGGGWTCSCADFVAHDACKHTREAAGRRAAQEQIAQHLKLGSADSFMLNRRAHAR
jgi:hypothetical protein